MRNVKNQAFKLAFAIAFAAFFVSAQSTAQDRPPRGGKPPQEAIDACVDMQEGDEVSFETRRGDTVTGTCEMKDEQLVAVPADHKH